MQIERRFLQWSWWLRAHGFGILTIASSCANPVMKVEQGSKSFSLTTIDFRASHPQIFVGRTLICRVRIMSLTGGHRGFLGRMGGREIEAMRVPLSFLRGVVVSFALLCACLAKRREPWAHQARNLKCNSVFFWRYREMNNGKWPSSFADIRRVAQQGPEPRTVFPYVDPTDGKMLDWLVFDPDLIGPYDGLGRIIAAAPRPGGPRADSRDQRMVMFDSGRIDWIPENRFPVAVSKTPQASPVAPTPLRPGIDARHEWHSVRRGTSS